MINTPLGLTFKGTIDGLDISANAENLISAEVIFRDQTPNKSADFTVTSGHATGAASSSMPGSLKNILYGSDYDDEIVLGGADLGAEGKKGDDRIIGNRQDNIFSGNEGDDTIFASKGNDTITLGKGRNFVDGGKGIDTVVYKDKLYRSSNLSKAGNIVNVDYADTLINVEFIQFYDVRISTKTLEIMPVLKVDKEVTVREGDNEITTVQLTLELSNPTSKDARINYTTFEIEPSQTALAGQDFIASSGNLIIPTGETKATINLEIVGDLVEEKNHLQIFGLHLFNSIGATFAKNVVEEVVVVYIEDDDRYFRINAGSNNEYIDQQGQKWFGNPPWIDWENGHANLTSNKIEGTEDDFIYQSEYLGKKFAFKV
ncbi:MAG: Calx-beta domain-containing protein [Cyanobacteria bacterium P01_G01_bin.39]